MRLKIRYYDVDKKQSVEMPIPADVVEIVIPEQEGLPSLAVNVNTDAIIVGMDGEKISQFLYTDIVGELL